MSENRYTALIQFTDKHTSLFFGCCFFLLDERRRPKLKPILTDGSVRLIRIILYKNKAKIISLNFLQKNTTWVGQSACQDFDFWRPNECKFISLTIGKLSKCVDD